MKDIKTRPDEFKRFHRALTSVIKFEPWYFKLMRHDKDPLIDVSWKSVKSRLSPKQAYQWIKAGFNVGVAATNLDPLVIIDIDDIGKTPDHMLQPTLSVKSRKRMGMHYFYLTRDARCKVNIPTDDWGEMRAMWEYVVAPGSYVETDDDLIQAMPESEVKDAGYYTLYNIAKPTYIIYDNIPEIFRDEIDAQKILDADNKTKMKSEYKSDSALYNLTVKDIFNIPDKKSRFPSMFHDSKTGKNTAIDDSGDWLVCWRHNVGHNSLSSLAVMSGMADCQYAGWGHTGSGIGPSTLDFKDGKLIYKLWKFAIKEGLIPDDDKIPSAARKYLENKTFS